MLQPPENPSQNIQADLTQWQLLLPFAGLVALQVVGAFVANDYVWGVSFWAVFPWWAMIVAVVSCMVLAIPAVALAVHSLLAAGWDLIVGALQIVPRPIRWVLAFVGFVAMAWILRSRALVYGDGFIVVSNMTLPWREIFAGVHEYLKPLSVILYKVGYVLLNAAFHLEAESAFGAVSAVGGGLGFIGLIRLVRILDDNRERRLWLAGAALTSGCIFYFLGHIELYVWGAAAFVWFLYFAQKSLEADSDFWPVIVTAVLMVGFNAMLLPTGLAVVLYLACKRWFSLSAISQRWLLSIPRLLLLITAASIAMACFLQFGLGSYGTVPIFARPDNAYWIFSLDHLADLLNLCLFAAPLCLLIPGLMALTPRLQAGRYALLSIAAVVPFVVTFWIDSEIGAPRDWDLLSFFGFPATLLAAALISNRLRPVQLRQAGIMALTLAALVIIPHAYVRLHAEIAIARVDRQMWQDPHYRSNYEQARRTLAWGAILHEQCQRGDLAEKYFERRVASKPDCDLGWYNLGVIAFAKKQYGKAANCFSHAADLKPTSNRYANSLLAAQLAQMQGR